MAWFAWPFAWSTEEAFGLTDGFWINMQAQYDLDMARIQLGDELEHVHKVGI
ncbi:helix-turn-helix transcriptional regulator [Mycobacterium botniense]|uniref:Uncharacterized protein n=1 Tax=Mycobacterium botniense TaxID=84962 RepID=A0A7I9XSG0_9MYCO|nr:hypothetical protein [Mycobacterium botniense]GFG72708.1 hypothetical protein MBOT_00730 [Mycobacterium botniense]